MFRRLILLSSSRAGQRFRALYWMPGLALILLGLLILLLPELLVAMVAGGLFFLGGTLLVLGWRIRKMNEPVAFERRKW